MGPRGVRRASLRRRRFAIWLILFKTPDTGRCRRICYCIFVAFGVPFVRPLGPFVLILAPFWLILEPFWCHLGPDLAYFAPSGVSFWLVLGEIQFLRQKFVKKHSCIDPGIKFLANFRMQTIFPRPGGGTIAAGNRDSPPGRLRPTAGAC